MAEIKNPEAYFGMMVRNSYKNEFRSNDNFFKNISSMGDEVDIQRESSRAISEHFAWLLQKYGLRKIRFHDLRHTCASFLVQNKIQMKQVQEWMGHSDIGTTGNIYSHLDFDSKLESADAISSIIRGDRAGEQSKEKTA